MYDTDDEEWQDKPLLDRLELDGDLVIQTDVLDAAEEVAAAFQALPHWKTNANPRLAFPTISAALPDGIVASSEVRLRTIPMSGGLRAKVSFLLNGHDVLRQRHRIPSTMRGVDGKRNFARPCTLTEDADLDLQVEAVAAVVERVRAIVEAVLPSCVVREAKLRTTAAELCLDIPVVDPRNALRRAGSAPTAGARSTERALFFAAAGGRHLTLRTKLLGTSGPVLKLYEKWEGHVRVEFAARARSGVVATEEGRHSALFSAEGVQALIERFYNSAGELLCRGADGFRTVLATRRNPFETLAALYPLLRLAMGERLEGGYTPNAVAVRQAQRAVVDLLTDGLTHAVGMPLGTQVRQALEGLVGPDGPLVRGRTTTIYCLAPGFACPLATEGEDGFENGEDEQEAEAEPA